jgi:hypothetical protein
MVRLVARGGELFEVASQNYRSGLNPKENSEDANIVCILHDDGMFSLYAHLSWNSIRGLTGGGEYALVSTSPILAIPAFPAGRICTSRYKEMLVLEWSPYRSLLEG